MKQQNVDVQQTVMAQFSACSHQTLFTHYVRMAEWSKALRSGRSPLLWAWVRIPLLTKIFLDINYFLSSVPNLFLLVNIDSRVAQWKRAGPITQRSVDRNYALLGTFL